MSTLHPSPLLTAYEREASLQYFGSPSPISITYSTNLPRSHQNVGFRFRLVHPCFSSLPVTDPTASLTLGNCFLGCREDIEWQ